MTFGDKIQALRKARGLSQEQLAAKMNVSRQAVSKWENGQSEPDTDKVILLSEYFGITTDYLLKNDPDSKVTQPMMQVKVDTNIVQRSKRFTISIITLLAGLLTSISIIIAAALNVPHQAAWSTSYPSKLWFLIFAGKGMFPDDAMGLGLGPVFIAGVVLVFLGVALLLREYFHKTKQED